MPATYSPSLFIYVIGVAFVIVVTGCVVEAVLAARYRKSLKR